MLCGHCQIETEPHCRWHEGPADCDAARARQAKGDCDPGDCTDPAAIRDDPRYPRKCGAVFEPGRHECVSSATHAGVVQHQHAHLAEQVRAFKGRLKEMEEQLVEQEKRNAHHLRILAEESTGLQAENERLTARIAELESAIGASVPNIIRCWLKSLPADASVSRGIGEEVLARVEEAMRT